MKSKSIFIAADLIPALLDGRKKMYATYNEASAYRRICKDFFRNCNVSAWRYLVCSRNMA